MEAKTNYTLVGLIVVILTIGLLAAALWLSVGFQQKQYKIYAVYMHEAVSGLSEESAVKYNGVQVGSVFKIELSSIDPQEVKILLNIEKGTPITTSTSATLISQGITGTTFVGLSASSSDLTPLQKIPAEPYPIIPTKPSLFNQIDSVIKQVSDNVNKVSIRLGEVFDRENAENLKKSLASLQQFTHVIEEHSDNIGHALKDSDTLLRNLATISNDLPAIVKELKSDMKKLTNDVSQAGQQITTTMSAGEITFNKLSQQTIPPAIILINHLNKIAVNLEKVSNEMRQNPAVVIRGTTAPKAGPGE